MQHKIKYYYLCDYASPEDMIFGEGELSDRQIELLKKAKPHNTNYYSIYLEDNTNFITLYSKNDLLNINEDILIKWNNSYGEVPMQE